MTAKTKPVCLNCGTKTKLPKRRYCSKKCAGKAHSVFMKGREPWHKGKTGVYSPEVIQAMRQRNQKKWLGENNPNWKGDDVGYFALHSWIRRTLGKPSRCKKCDTKDTYRYEWANISGKYKRDIADWISLCVKCHRVQDDNIAKMWVVIRKNNATKNT
jgi:hypothetical protein